MRTDVTSPSHTAILTLWRAASRRDPDLHEVAQLLSTQPALSAATLRFANSSYMGAAYPVGSILQAVVRVGSRAVGSLAAARLGRSMMGEIGDEVAWSRALVVARAAKVAGRLIGMTHEETEELFVAGLFSESGFLVNARSDGRYEAWMADARRQLDDTELLAAEAATFGTDHAARAGAILVEWNLPPDIAGAVATHHAPSTLFDRVLAACMRLSGEIICMGEPGDDPLADIRLSEHTHLIMREARMFADTTAAALA